MKTMISSFGGYVLSREQMKKIVGGVCHIYFDTVDGGEASITVNYGTSQSSAVNYANSKMGGSINGSSSITGYRVNCDEM